MDAENSERPGNANDDSEMESSQNQQESEDIRQNIDFILSDWPFDPAGTNVRMIQVEERIVLQMRVDMGLLQLETDGRPDGSKPENFDTYFGYLQDLQTKTGDEFMLDEKQCIEIDREFVQFYHRRICWLQLKEFDRARTDADHTLALMDFSKIYSPDEQWTISHEQYRPFVLYHRTKAAALHELEVHESPEGAIEQINTGLENLSVLFEEYDANEQFENDELVQRLMEFRETLREKYDVGRTLQERLADAIETEQYELAAELRDLLDKRGSD